MDKKIFTIQIDGIEKSYKDVLSLSEVLKQLENSNVRIATTTQSTTEATEAQDKAQKQYQDTLNRIAKLEEDATKQQIAATQTLRERRSVVEQEVKVNTANEGSIKQMGAQLSLLRKQYDNLSKSERESEQVGGKLLNQIQDLDAAYKEAKESTGRFQDSVGNYEKATASLVEQAGEFKRGVGELEDQLALLISQGVSPTSEQFQELAKQAGEAKRAVNEAAATVDAYASSAKGLSSVINVGESLTAAFGTATGVMSMFGVSGEEVAQQIAKLQGVMATLQSLQVLQENITKKGTATNLLYSKVLGVLGLDHKKNAAALATETAAQGASTVATNTATVATKGFSKALIATGIGAIVVLLGLLIANFSEIKDWFLKLIAPIDGFKAALMGIGSVVVNYIVAPFKALFKLMKGDFSGAVDEFKKGFDVMGNYAEGKKASIAASNAERNKKFVEGALATTDTLIKNNEAKYGSDYKYTEEGKKLYQKYYAYQLSLAKDDKEKFAEIQREKWAFDRELNEKQKEEAKKKAEDAKKISDERKKALEDYKKSLDSFNKDTYALSITNEEKLIAAQKKAAKTSEEVALAYGKEGELLKQKNEDEKKKVEEQYSELIKKAEKLKQDTTKITEAKNARLKELEEKQKVDLIDLETEKTEAINKINEDAKKKKIEETQKALDSELKLMNSHYTSIQDLTKNAVKRTGKLDLIDVKATKENYKKIGEELNKYLDNLNSSKDRISKYYDDMAGVYSKDSQEFKDLQEKKRAALNDVESKIKVTNKNIEDNTQASTQSQQQYYSDLAEKMAKAFESVNELLSGAFDAAQSIFDMQLEEAQAKLDEVSEAYDEAVEKKEESNARLAELEEEAKTATGGRAQVVQEQISREMDNNKQLAQQEKELAKEKEKREKEVAKIEKKQKKTQLAQNLITGIAQTALGVTQALASSPLPVSFIMAALVGAMGAIQTGIIAAQMAKLEKGGLLSGKRHSEGGIPVGNTGIEVEGGEYVVNRVSTQKNLGLIEYINTSRKEVQVNDVVSFFNGKGSTITPAPTFKVQYETGGQLTNIDTVTAATSTDNRILDALNSIDFKPSVSVKEIQDVQSRMTSVRELAGASN